jgi:hypothetical protein
MPYVISLWHTTLLLGELEIQACKEDATPSIMFELREPINKASHKSSATTELAFVLRAKVICELASKTPRASARASAENEEADVFPRTAVDGS